MIPANQFRQLHVQHEIYTHISYYIRLINIITIIQIITKFAKLNDPILNTFSATHFNRASSK